MHAEMLIDGHLIGGPCDQSVSKSVIRNPYDNSLVGTAAEGDENALMTAVAAANDAFPKWRKSAPVERANILNKVSKTIRERREELAELLVLEIGKPITLAEGEVDRMAVTFELAANLAASLGPKELPVDYDARGSSYTASVERFPIGVVFAIVPYNWPFNLTAHKVAPALAAGNTVVVKPSPQALLSTYALGRLLHECGVPPGVVNVVDAPVAAVQKAVQDSRVKVVSFTGSDAVGWKLKAALPPFTKCTLELGGDASAMVFADADLGEACKRIVNGAYAYAGQICISIQHVLIEATIYDEFVAQLVSATANCPTGDPSLRETVCGPVISSSAADRIQEWVAEAVVGGAKCLVGGHRDGNVLTPALYSDVPAGSRLQCSEAFGPVLTVSPFDSIDEANARVNESKYGIHAGVFTASPGIADECYRDLEVGGVVLNDSPSVRFDGIPYGGVKRSGFGREGVESAWQEMTEPKSRVSRR